MTATTNPIDSETHAAERNTRRPGSMTSALTAIALVLQIMLLARWWSTPQPATPLRGHLLIDVNTASAEELSVLPHVGPTLARRVVENRERLGRFATVDDLTRVHGVGQNTLQKIRPYCVAVCNPTTDSTQLTTDN